MLYREFLEGVSVYRAANPDQRWGQATFNYMHSIFPAEVDRLRGSDVDPFYNNDRVNDFLFTLGIGVLCD